LLCKTKSSFDSKQFTWYQKQDGFAEVGFLQKKRRGRSIAFGYMLYKEAIDLKLRFKCIASVGGNRFKALL